jgi:MSHA biogenesis protein MshK
VSKNTKIVLALVIMGFCLNTYSAQDPMRPPNWIMDSQTMSTRSIEPLTLQQILVSKNRKIAIINEKIVTEGSSIAGGKVLKISDEWVRVIRAGRSVTLIIAPTTKEYIREN